MPGEEKAFYSLHSYHGPNARKRSWSIERFESSPLLLNFNCVDTANYRLYFEEQNFLYFLDSWRIVKMKLLHPCLFYMTVMHILMLLWFYRLFTHPVDTTNALTQSIIFSKMMNEQTSLVYANNILSNNRLTLYVDIN